MTFCIGRRDFITLIGGAAAAWPLAARAQQSERMRRVGILMNTAADDPEPQTYIAAFRQTLQQLGWTEGRNVQFDTRWGAGSAESFRRYGAELVALAPDLIIAAGVAVVNAVQAASRAVPIVFAQAIDPVGAGVVASLSRPGGKVTGFMQFEYGLSGKWPELLKAIAPGMTRVAILRDPTNPAGIGQWAIIQAAASSLGMEVTPILVREVGEIEQGIEAFARGSGGLIVRRSSEQQATALLHRGREQLVRQRTMLVNALRAHLAEFGIVAAQGLRNVRELIAIVRDDGDTRLPDVARQVLQVLADQIEQIETAVAGLERQLLAWHKTNPVSQRLASIPGIGPIIATAIATTVADPKVFRSGREFAAWLGLVPRQNSTGGKTRLGGITKRGNRYLRRLLINGASANLLRSKATKADPWVIGLRRRRPPLVVAVALANKTARIAWAVMLRQREYQPRAVAA
jgi:transposase